MVLWNEQKLKLLWCICSAKLPDVSIHEFLCTLPVWIYFGNDSHKPLKYLLLTARTPFGVIQAEWDIPYRFKENLYSSSKPEPSFLYCSAIVLSREHSQCVTSWHLWALWSIPRGKHRLERWHCSGDHINEHHTYEICHCGKWEIDSNFLTWPIISVRADIHNWDEDIKPTLILDKGLLRWSNKKQ